MQKRLTILPSSMQNIRTIAVSHGRSQIESMLGCTIRHRGELNIIDIILITLVGWIVKRDINRRSPFVARPSHNSLGDIDRGLSVGVGGVLVAEKLGDFLHLAFVGVFNVAGGARNAGRLGRWIHGSHYCRGSGGGRGRAIIGGAWIGRHCAGGRGIAPKLLLIGWVGEIFVQVLDAGVHVFHELLDLRCLSIEEIAKLD